MTRLLKSLVAAAAIAFVPAVALAEGDAEKGEKLYKRCTACHDIGEGAKNKVGPHQNNLIGRTAGTAEDYKYSKLNQAAGEAGLVWTEENVVEYLEDPTKFLINYLKENGKEDEAKGRSKMVYKLRDLQDREDVVAYLKKFSPATN